MSDGSSPAAGTNYVIEKLLQDRALIEVSMGSARSDIANYEAYIERRKADLDGMEGNLLAIDAAVRSLQAS